MSFTSNAVASGSTNSLLHEILETGSDNDEEYIPLLTSCQYHLDNQDLECENEDKKNEIDTGSTRKRKRKLARAIHMLDTIIKNTNLYVLSKSASATGLFKLPSLDQYWNKTGKFPIHTISRQMPLKRFEQIKRKRKLARAIHMLDTIIKNTNLYVLSKSASATGLFKLPSLDQYWNKTGKFPIHTISRQMPLKRFEQIKRYLHISSTTATIKNYFDKLKLLLSHIWDVSKQLYISNSNISVDEIIIRFSGRSVHTQNRIGACGTVRKTSAGFPKELKLDKGIKLDWDVRSGVVVNDVLVVLWQDNGPVTMLLKLTIYGITGEEWKIDWKRRQPRETSTNVAKVQVVFGPEFKKKLKILKTIYGITGEEWKIDWKRRQPRETSTNVAKVQVVFGPEFKKKLKILKYAESNTAKLDTLFFWLLNTVIINSYQIIQTAGSTQKQQEFCHKLVWNLINFANNTGKIQLRNNLDNKESRKKNAKRAGDVRGWRTKKK
ncbi:hypothetical protein Glove_290g31 [Diversispora epigaea]|uniref:PiggyBac transposable element-derived protein domain-containing protein n=1 Tax=Diversispora epigaea TaxID=1348612 RepID=A0A397I0G8_9GLOM|nr:hypothetical protein Glove_290g31 [Diversispora epigaea]